MNDKILFCLLFFSGISLSAEELMRFNVRTSSEANGNLEFVLRVPANYSKTAPEKYGIMILFGGRNWPGDKTIETYKFDKLADKHGLFLLSPSFKDDDYWTPEKWSGKALMEAVEKVGKDYGIPKNKKLLYYGYSAGGQCSNLFANWKPEIVSAWGAHACGVWPKSDDISKTADAFVTCGEDDAERWQLSMAFVHDAREKGRPVIWKPFPGQDHELSKEALLFAEKFFDSFLRASDKTIKFVGDDQSMKYYPAGSKKASLVEIEDANLFRDEELARVWGKGE